jgi:hypothetical protein
MLNGGVGCVRLKPKEVSGERVWFMGASSSGFAHQGIPVALPDGLYERAIERIAKDGFCLCDLTGRLTHIPDDLDPLYEQLVRLPQLYLLVEQLEFLPMPSDAEYLADGAVLVEATATGESPDEYRELADGIYAAFVSFTPQPRAIREAADWLSETYVGELLQGRVITDFDKQVRRFDNTVFSLEHIMRGLVNTPDTERLLDRCGAPSRTRQLFSERVLVLNTIDTQINVRGDENVIATRGGAAASRGGAAAAGENAVADSSVRIASVQRLKTSTWAKAFGSAAIVTTVAATILLATGVTDIAIAGFIVAVVATLAGAVPLFRP